jgi:adenylyltransferase/sulfurtransferase
MKIPGKIDIDTLYSRQIALMELGKKGQKKLSQAKVAVIGLGGIGSASSLYLALAGIGYLRLIDQDTIELHNLHRQILYDLDDLHHPKVEAAANRIRKVNPHVKVESFPENVRESNIEEIIHDIDCVVDGLDNMRTRYIVNRACAKLRIPYVFGAAIGLEGSLSVFTPPETPCLECILPGIDDRHLPTCETRGVLGATAGIIGTMQAMEAIKLLSGIGPALKSKLMFCDFDVMSFVTIDISKNPNCSVCGEKDKPKATLREEQLIWLCGSNTVNINPSKPLSLKPGEAYGKLKQYFHIMVNTPIAVVFEFDDVEVSLFNNGRALVKNVKDEETALKIYRSVLEKLL